MKNSTILSLLAYCLLLISCNSSEAPEINDFRVQAAMSTSVAGVSMKTANTSTVKVSFVGSCVTVISTDELLNMVMATTEGEVTLTDLGKRSGMFCSPNSADVTAVWISTASKHVSKHDNKTIAQK